MKIEQLTIENFKCFKREQTFDFGRLTVLTGANSSGKSTVIHAILGAFQSEYFPLLFSPNGRFVNMGDFKEISNFHNPNNIIRLNFGINFQNNIINIETSWHENKKNRLPQLVGLTLKGENWIKLYNITWERGLSLPNINFNRIDIDLKRFKGNPNYNLTAFKEKLIAFSKQQEIDYVVGDDEVLSIKNFTLKSIPRTYALQSDSILFKHFISILFLEPTSLIDIEDINFIGAFRQSPERTYFEKNKNDFKIDKDGGGYLDQIVEWKNNNSSELKDLLKIMINLNLIKDIKPKRLSGGRFEILVKSVTSGLTTSLSNVGYGISQFLPIIVADLQLSDDSTLFLAEPEIHLHPSVQAKFGDYIVNQINNSEKNYVIETHSEYFLNRIRLAIVKGELKKEDVKIYFMENKGDDTDVYDIDFKKNGAIKNAPKNYFKTYMTDTMDIALNAFAE